MIDSQNPWRDYETDPPPLKEAILLIWLEEPILNSRLHVGTWHPNIQGVAGRFLFDIPKILKWKYAEEFFYKEQI